LRESVERLIESKVPEYRALAQASAGPKER